MKKIWLCGASGMLGSHFQRLLLVKKIPFIATDHAEVDITKLDAVLSFAENKGFSHLINCAAYTNVDLAEDEPQKAFLVNELGGYHLALAAKQNSLKLIHFSTDYVFDGRASFPYSEEVRCHPLSVYGSSKYLGEVKIQETLSQAVIIRTSWLFGWPGKNFVNTILRLMKEREILKIVSDQVGRPTYCEDLAEAALSLLDEEGIFHFSNRGETSWFDFAKRIVTKAQALDFPSTLKSIFPIPSSEYVTKAKRPFYSILDTGKVETILKRPIRDWDEALDDYLQLLKSHDVSEKM